MCLDDIPLKKIIQWCIWMYAFCELFINFMLSGCTVNVLHTYSKQMVNLIKFLVTCFCVCSCDKGRKRTPSYDISVTLSLKFFPKSKNILFL